MNWTRALVIINPSSGQHAADETQQIIAARLAAAELPYELRTTAGADDARRWANAAPGADFDLVVVAGGDGTIMEALSGLIESGAAVPLAQLPVGTANLLARALAIPTDLAAALDVVLAGHVARLDVGYLPHERRYFTLAAGCGYDAELIGDATRELKNVLGWAAYVASGIKHLFMLRRSRIELTIDGERRRLRASMVLITNIGQLGVGGLSVGPDIDPHDGRLNVVVASAATVGGALRTVLRIVTRRFTGHRDLHYFSGASIAITATPPLPVQVDGEMLGSTPLAAQVVPGGALLVVPPPAEPV